MLSLVMLTRELGGVMFLYQSSFSFCCFLVIWLTLEAAIVLLIFGLFFDAPQREARHLLMKFASVRLVNTNLADLNDLDVIKQDKSDNNILTINSLRTFLCVSINVISFRYCSGVI